MSGGGDDGKSLYSASVPSRTTPGTKYQKTNRSLMYFKWSWIKFALSARFCNNRDDDGWILINCDYCIRLGVSLLFIIRPFVAILEMPGVRNSPGTNFLPAYGFIDEKEKKLSVYFLLHNPRP